MGLYDAVDSHIPAWKNLGICVMSVPPVTTDAPLSFGTTPTLRPMKVLDLLTHTSDLSACFPMRTAVDAAYRQVKVADPQPPGELARIIDQLAQIPLDFPPGTD